MMEDRVLSSCSVTSVVPNLRTQVTCFVRLRFLKLFSLTSENHGDIK